MGDEDVKPCMRSLLRSGGRFALGLSALRFSRCPRGGALRFLRSLVRTHWTAKAAAALKGPAPAPEVAELALVG